MANPNAPTSHEQEMIRSLRQRGFAVIIFSPEELKTATAHSVERRLVELGNEAISDLQE